MDVQDTVGTPEGRRGDAGRAAPSAVIQTQQRRSRCDSGAVRSPPSRVRGPGRMSGELAISA